MNRLGTQRAKSGTVESGSERVNLKQGVRTPRLTSMHLATVILVSHPTLLVSVVIVVAVIDATVLGRDRVNKGLILRSATVLGGSRVTLNAGKRDQR